MELVYHTLITCQAVGDRFDPAGLAQIIRANHGQDGTLNQLRGHLHFDNRIDDGWDYIEAEHANLAKLAAEQGSGDSLRAAFGRLTHAAQDFYAHTNYVRLWLALKGGLNETSPDDIDVLDAGLMGHPELCTGSFVLWRDWVYHVPVVKRLVRGLHVPPGSHEAMHLDSPARGPEFAYAYAAACQRTRHEYWRAAKAILHKGGEGALGRFHHAQTAMTGPKG
jgi:hypothetical protein